VPGKLGFYARSQPRIGFAAVQPLTLPASRVVSGSRNAFSLGDGATK
jgi:hypothetical protein